MAELEKVIRGLKCIICPNTLCGNCTYFVRNENDPDTGWCDRDAIYKDALTLLKAQEPRVMQFTEAMDAEVAWLEMYANPDDGVKPIIQPVIIRYYENGYWQCLIEQDESADLSLFLDGFGTEFRFWTSRPTDEQREKVKWE